MNSRPNVLVIMYDQLTPAALGCYGSRVTQSPHIDRVAAAGVVFDAAYTNSPLCTPARYCMMTGQLPSATRGYDNAAYLASTIPTYAHYLRAAGYRTHYRGKWHLSHPDLLVPGTHSALMTNDTAGTVLDHAVDLYRRTDRLDGFGGDGDARGRQRPGVDDGLGAAATRGEQGGADVAVAGNTPDPDRIAQAQIEGESGVVGDRQFARLCPAVGDGGHADPGAAAGGCQRQSAGAVGGGVERGIDRPGQPPDQRTRRSPGEVASLDRRQLGRGNDRLVRADLQGAHPGGQFRQRHLSLIHI